MRQSAASGAIDGPIPSVWSHHALLYRTCAAERTSGLIRAMAGCPGVTWQDAQIPRGDSHRSSEPFLPYRAIPCMPPPPWTDAMQEACGAAHLGKLRSAHPITAAGGAQSELAGRTRGVPWPV